MIEDDDDKKVSGVTIEQLETDEDPESVPFEEEESLKELYKELTLSQLTLVVLEKDSEQKIQCTELDELPEPVIPYGGETIDLKDLNKEMTIGDLRARISDILGWPDDEIRLWDQLEFEHFLKGTSDPWSVSKYRPHVPNPLEDEVDTLIFPMFVTGQLIVAEQVDPIELGFPKSPLPEYLSKPKWWRSLQSDWNGAEPPINKIVYKNVEIVAIPRNNPSNSLFAALGYQLHNIGCVKGVEYDEDEEGLTQASIYRAQEIRKDLARFVVDNAEKIEASGLLENNSADDYIEKVLDYEYSGGNVDLWIASIFAGCLIQVFDIPSRRMRQYGKGHVEKYGHPDRLGERFAIKLARWKGGAYDAMTFSLQQGMDPIRREEPFRVAYSLLAFEWMLTQPKKIIGPLRSCAQCNLVETSPNQFDHCSQCKLVYYCRRKCQIFHWKESHNFICVRRNPDEALKSRQEEMRARADMRVELAEIRGKKPKGSTKSTTFNKELDDDSLIDNLKDINAKISLLSVNDKSRTIQVDV